MLLKIKLDHALGFLSSMEFWVLGFFNSQYNKLCNSFGVDFFSFSAVNNCPSLIFPFRYQNGIMGATCRGLQ